MFIAYQNVPERRRDEDRVGEGSAEVRVGFHGDRDPLAVHQLHALEFFEPEPPVCRGAPLSEETQHDDGNEPAARGGATLIHHGLQASNVCPAHDATLARCAGGPQGPCDALGR